MVVLNLWCLLLFLTNPNFSAEESLTTEEPILRETTVEVSVDENYGNVILTQANDTNLNETMRQDLLEIYHKQIQDFKNWIKDPYVHGMILPAIIGVAASLCTVCMLCTIQSCVKTTARRRRRRRIQNLSEDLKSDKSGLLADDSEEEI